MEPGRGGGVVEGDGSHGEGDIAAGAPDVREQRWTSEQRTEKNKAKVKTQGGSTRPVPGRAIMAGARGAPRSKKEIGGRRAQRELVPVHRPKGSAQNKACRRHVLSED